MGMCKKLPVGGFKWDGSNKYTEDVIKNYDEHSKYGALLEVTINYPIELQQLHKH